MRGCINWPQARHVWQAREAFWEKKSKHVLNTNGVSKVFASSAARVVMHIVRVEQTQASSANAVTLSLVTQPRDPSVHLARPFPFFPYCTPTCTRY
jgi:ABC-type transporter Mla MlaB component